MRASSLSLGGGDADDWSWIPGQTAVANWKKTLGESLHHGAELGDGTNLVRSEYTGDLGRLDEECMPAFARRIDGLNCRKRVWYHIDAHMVSQDSG